jgi:hypothetical protein
MTTTGERIDATMPKLILVGAALAVTVAGLGCGPRLQPRPAAAPAPPPDPVMERKKAAARYQEELVMNEVGKTNPVLTATLDRNLEGLRTALAKTPGRVNELRRDLRLGPPLREACRLKWAEGISVLLDHGAKCLGDSQCEACAARARGGAPGSLGGAAHPGDARPRQSTPAALRTTP